MQKTLYRAFSALVVLTLGSASALADITTLRFTWSGSSFGNTASAAGYITVEDSVLPAVLPAPFFPLPDPSVIALELTVSGASVGNGTFRMADFSSMTFWSPVPLDLSRELIGQDMGGGCTFGTSDGVCGSGNSGDFNFGGLGSDAPNGEYFFNLATAGGEQMLIMSITAIPEPLTATMLPIGVALLGLTVNRRRHLVLKA